MLPAAHPTHRAAPTSSRRRHGKQGAARVYLCGRLEVRPSLTPSPFDDGERQTILRRLVLLDAGLEIDETPEMLAAIDAGIASMDTGPGVTIEEARQRLAGWMTK